MRYLRSFLWQVKYWLQILGLSFRMLKERLDGLIQECEDKLSGDVITTTDVRVIQALQSYKGPAGPYDQITFADYKSSS